MTGAYSDLLLPSNIDSGLVCLFLKEKCPFSLRSALLFSILTILWKSKLKQLTAFTLYETHHMNHVLTAADTSEKKT